MTEREEAGNNVPNLDNSTIKRPKLVI